jgi:hypothetical protein
MKSIKMKGRSRVTDKLNQIDSAKWWGETAYMD